MSVIAITVIAVVAVAAVAFGLYKAVTSKGVQADVAKVQATEAAVSNAAAAVKAVVK